MGMFEFDSSRTSGTATEAAEWVNTSPLSPHHKQNLLQFVNKFPSLTFTKDSEQFLQDLEIKDGLKLPPWMRKIRKTLSFTYPPMCVRFDDYDFFTPRSDDVEDIWYMMDLGYMREGQRTLFVEKAHHYLLGGWEDSDLSYLGINTISPQDEKIYEFASEDVIDKILDGNPAEDSIYPAFESYSSMLSHITEGRIGDTIISAQ
ncbi:hypothetical protein [Streptomyces sp. NPDC024089]|uniref:hypothetical protein n=1 Tax=Streptomyces sp. NPDC024089 TaxID=3154328 RepID=UPI0033D7268E